MSWIRIHWRTVFSTFSCEPAFIFILPRLLTGSSCLMSGRMKTGSVRKENFVLIYVDFHFALTRLTLFLPWCVFGFQAYLPLTFWITLLDAFYQSLVCFFVPYFVSHHSCKVCDTDESWVFIYTLPAVPAYRRWISHIVKLIINWLKYNHLPTYGRW